MEHFLVNLKVEAAGMAGIMGDDEEWVAKAGFLENIPKLVAEYTAVRKVQPLRLCVLGPPASGVSLVLPLPITKEILKN